MVGMTRETMQQIMDGLVDGLAPKLPGSVLGEVFDRLIWVLDDNGAQLIDICQEWLVGDDRRRVEAALSLGEVFLYDTREELEAHLAPVAARWPDLAPTVADLLASWDAAHPRT